MSHISLPIVGRQICLRDWSTEDLPGFEKWNKPGHEWQSFDGPYYRSEIDDSAARTKELESKILRNDFLDPRSRLVIADKNSNQLIGTVSSYWESKETNWLSAGITIYDSSFWGKGIGYEALGLWIEYLFASYPEIVRLDMRTWSGNHGLMRLARKLGFQQEACFRRARIVKGEYFDGLGYGILRQEWDQSFPDGFRTLLLRKT